MTKERVSVRVSNGETFVKRADGSLYAFRAADTGSQELAAYNPVLRDANTEIGRHRDKIVSRARDQGRNNPWAAGGIDRRVDSVIGSDLWLSAKPNYRLLGWTPEQSAQVARQIEDEFWAYGEDPLFNADVERDLTFGGMMELAYRHVVTDGDAFAVTYWLEGRGKYRTAFRIMDPDMVANPDGRSNSETLRDGIEVDANTGAAVAYHFRKAHPKDPDAAASDQMKFARIPREESWGRPRVVHYHNKARAHQRRGISRFVSSIARMRMLENYDASELQAAVISAVLGLYVTSERDPRLTAASLAPVDLDGLDAVESYRDQVYAASPPTFNGVRLPIMAGGDKIQSIQANRPAENFPAFEAAVLRSIASSFGLTYEQLASDWSQVNYSSARAALNEVWRGFIAERKKFIARFVKPLYAAWLEEAIEYGHIVLPPGSPDFWAARSAYCASNWIGPARGFIDPLKEAEAAKARILLGISTLENEVSSQGEDYRLVLEQQARERTERKALGLPDPMDTAVAAAAPH